MILSRHSAKVLAIFAIPLLGWAAKPAVDPNTPEGRLLERVQTEGDLSKRLVLLELFPDLFPTSPLVESVWGELQARYHQAGKLDKALAAGSNVLIYNANNLEAACLNWRIAADMKDSALTAVWMKQAGYVAEKVLKTPDPDMSKATRECGANARQANEFEAYKAAVTAKNPADRIKLLEEFLKDHPQTQHAGDIEITLFLTYREQGDSAKALAAAEKLVAHNDTREDAMLLVAESYFKSGKDPNGVVSLSKKAINRLTSAEKPDGMSDTDWARTKTAELTQANYMIGSVSFQAEKWEAADQAFRAALPNLTDSRFRAEVLSSLGWANYKLKNVSDAIKFYSDCTNIPGPFQLAASKTLNTITAEYRIK
ncbi:MAG: tetratricopeptide repeat protein [Acidobacteriia bacterium]|nr:tetratricopeptide repeat protein [Terriglobia bacterium]